MTTLNSFTINWDNVLGTLTKYADNQANLGAGTPNSSYIVPADLVSRGWPKTVDELINIVGADRVNLRYEAAALGKTGKHDCVRNTSLQFRGIYTTSTGMFDVVDERKETMTIEEMGNG